MKVLIALLFLCLLTGCTDTDLNGNKIEVTDKQSISYTQETICEYGYLYGLFSAQEPMNIYSIFAVPIFDESGKPKKCSLEQQEQAE